MQSHLGKILMIQVISKGLLTSEIQQIYLPSSCLSHLQQCGTYQKHIGLFPPDSNNTCKAAGVSLHPTMQKNVPQEL